MHTGNATILLNATVAVPDQLYAVTAIILGLSRAFAGNRLY